MRAERAIQVLVAALAVATLTAGARVGDLNEPTTGFLFLLAVLFLSMWGGCSSAP